MKKEYFKKIRGFTLVEALVAVGILSLAIAATFSAVQNGLQSSRLAKDRVIASYLAQDAIEFIRNIRDSNALLNVDGTPPSWWLDTTNNSAISDDCGFSTPCIVDSFNNVVSVCPPLPAGCTPLKQDPASGLYEAATRATRGLPDSNFRRSVTFLPIPNLEAATILVQITWQEGGKQQSYQTSEDLYNHG